ncbi:glycosyltransferase family 4 protein [bacterium]|nr:glycosyltransferase family 4 protein [bacterium]
MEFLKHETNWRRPILYEREKSMRILIIQPGIGPYRLDFFNRLAQLCTLKVIYFYDEATEQKFPEPLAKKIHGCDVEKVTGGWDLRRFYPIRPRLGAVIADFRPDVVIGYEFNTLMMHLAVLRRLCFRRWRLLLWSSDNLEITRHCSRMRKIARWFGTRACDGMLLYSEEVRKFYARSLLPGRKTVVLPNIQDENRIRRDVFSSEREASILTERYNLKGHAVILYVGRLHSVKNLPILIDAFSTLNRRNVKLILVGSGSEEELLRRKVAESGLDQSVIFAGNCYGKKLWAHYFIADCLVLPSRFEPFGAVVNEALAWGIPCVVSKYVGARVLIRSSRQGEIFDPDEQNALKCKLNSLLQRISSKREPRVKESLMPWTLEDHIENLIAFCHRISGSDFSGAQRISRTPGCRDLD